MQGFGESQVRVDAHAVLAHGQLEGLQRAVQVADELAHVATLETRIPGRAVPRLRRQCDQDAGHNDNELREEPANAASPSLLCCLHVIVLIPRPLPL